MSPTARWMLGLAIGAAVAFVLPVTSADARSGRQPPGGGERPPGTGPNAGGDGSGKGSGDGGEKSGSGEKSGGSGKAGGGDAGGRAQPGTPSSGVKSKAKNSTGTTTGRGSYLEALQREEFETGRADLLAAASLDVLRVARRADRAD